MLKKITTIFILIFMISILIMPFTALAQGNSLLENLDDAAGQEGAGYTTFKPNEEKEVAFAVLMGNVVRTFISLLGIIFIVYTIYGGFLWMTAAGNEENVTKAKSIIKNGIIGLFVILSSAAIYYFISNALIGPSRPPPPTGNPI